MRYGAMNNPRKKLLEEVRLFGDFGFDYVDLTVEYPQATPEKVRANMKALQDTLSTYNMGLVGHMPWFLNIIHPYDGVRAAMLAECRNVFEVCRELGIEHVTVHPDYMKLKRERKEIRRKTVESLTELVKAASDSGVTLCFENFEEDYFKVEDLRNILEETDGLKMTLDVGHAYMKSGGMDAVVGMIRELSGWLTHVHVHDNHGGHDEHLPLGVGNIEFDKVVKTLKIAGYDKTITLEIHSDDREYLQISLRKMKEMWSGPS
jgi:sugar phosphate isomerase/epimerase